MSTERVKLVRDINGLKETVRLGVAPNSHQTNDSYGTAGVAKKKARSATES